MRNNCTFPNYVDSNPQFLFSFPFPGQPNTMATASGDWVRLFFKGGEEEKRLPPFPHRQTWWSCWAVTRTRHTYCLSLHPQMHRLKLTRPPASLPLSTPLTCQFLSCLPLANVVINLFLSVSLAESMGCPWSRCWHCCNGQGWSRLTGIQCSMANTGQFQDTFVPLCVQKLCLWNPQGWLLQMRNYP